MKISFDTKEDSAEDIKKIVKMLQAWLEGHTNAPLDMFSSQSSDGSPSPAVSEGLFNIFGDNKEKTDSTASQSSASQPSIIDLDKKDSYDDEIPPVVPY